MWRIFDNKMEYISGDEGLLEMPFMLPDWDNFSGDCLVPFSSQSSFQGYDDWVSLFSRESEYDVVQKSILRAAQGERIHIRGVSSRESIECIADYYRQKGYEDSEKNTFTFPPEEPLTFSISLRHALWCEKDKHFLKNKDQSGYPYAQVCPPLRTPADLRTIQQSLRMNICMGVEVFPGDEIFLNQILEKQILTPFQLAQMTFFRWGKYGFTGEKHTVGVVLPRFSLDTFGDS